MPTATCSGGMAVTNCPDCAIWQLSGICHIRYIVAMNENVDQSGVQTHVRLGSGGRVVLPAIVRRELGLQEGDRLIVRVVDGTLQMMSVRASIRMVQRLAAAHPN